LILDLILDPILGLLGSGFTFRSECRDVQRCHAECQPPDPRRHLQVSPAGSLFVIRCCHRFS
jgi:hypothetical protein